MKPPWPQLEVEEHRERRLNATLPEARRHQLRPRHEVAEAPALRGQAIENRTGLVSGAVVHGDDFEVRVVLVE